MESVKGSFPPIPKSLEHSKPVFHGKKFDVHGVELVTRGGTVVHREAVVHPGAVVILPLIDPYTVLLIQNYRFAVGEELWELPAGTLEKGEAPEATAARELVEETGYDSANITFLTKFYTSPGICTEMMYAYVGKELTFVGQNLTEEEEISIFTFDWPAVLKMIEEGKIRDGKTIATLLHYYQFCK